MGEFGGLRQSHGYLHILHLPGVSTKETHSLSPHRCIQMQSKVNVIMLPLFFLIFFFPEHFVLALICALPCISIVSLKGDEKRELCAGFNSICVEICCNICLAAGQVKYSHFIKWRYATVIAHLVPERQHLLWSPAEVLPA